MKMRVLAYYHVIIVMLASIFAAGPALAHGSSGTFLVTKVTVEGDRVFIHGANIQNPDNCATSNYAVIVPTSANVDRFLSVALTALSTQRPVTMYFQGCIATNWHTGAPYASTIDIQ